MAASLIKSLGCVIRPVRHMPCRTQTFWPRPEPSQQYSFYLILHRWWLNIQSSKCNKRTLLHHTWKFIDIGIVVKLPVVHESGQFTLYCILSPFRPLSDTNRSRKRGGIMLHCCNLWNFVWSSRLKFSREPDWTCSSLKSNLVQTPWSETLINWIYIKVHQETKRFGPKKKGSQKELREGLIRTYPRFFLLLSVVWRPATSLLSVQIKAATFKTMSYNSAKQKTRSDKFISAIHTSIEKKDKQRCAGRSHSRALHVGPKRRCGGIPTMIPCRQDSEFFEVMLSKQILFRFLANLRV